MIEPVQYPRARLDLYEEAVVLTRYEGDDRRTSYPVAVDDLVAALSRVPVSSGLLPPGCLFWERTNGETRMAVCVPGRRWRLPTAERIYDIPLPPLVFAGAGVQYRVYAVKHRPQAIPIELYHCPTPTCIRTASSARALRPFRPVRATLSSRRCTCSSKAASSMATWHRASARVSPTMSGSSGDASKP
jgi:hypothetical protein